MRGPGMRVELADSALADSPSGDINDLVIHSSDVQAVVVIKLGHANQPSLSIENDARIGLWIEAGGVVALSNGLKVDVFFDELVMAI